MKGWPRNRAYRIGGTGHTTRLGSPPVLLTSLVAVFLSFSCLSVAGSEPGRPPSILILNSYHHGFEWSDKETVGFLEGLRGGHPDADVRIEYLDSKRFPGKEQQELVKRYLLDKYRAVRVDLVVAMDNPALDLVTEERDELFPETPVVFAGISDFTPAMLKGRTECTGVTEMQDNQRTLALALSHNPGATQIFAVHDYTASGLAVRRELESLTPFPREGVRITFNQSVTFEELAKQLEALSTGSIVIISSFATDRNGRSLPLGESTELLTARTKVPVYGTHETRLGHGIVGGYLLSGKEHGRRAASLALRILGGEKASAIPVEVRTTSVPMFDYTQLKRFGIRLDTLPAGSLVINRPVSFYEENKTLIWTALSIISVLSMLTVALVIVVVRQRRAEKALQASEEKYRMIIETANEGIWMLNGVSTITFANRKMADLLGYNTAELRGMRATGFMFEEDLPDHEARMAEQGRGVSSQYEQRLRTKSGDTLWAIVSSTPIINKDGRCEGTFAMLGDITGRKLAEEERETLQRQLAQAQKLESVGRLAGGVAHDFNNMLAVILGRTELALMKSRPPDPHYAAFREIRKAAEHSADLTRQLLAFARRQTVAPKVVDLNQTVEGMLGMLRRLIGEDVDLAWMPATGLWTVKIDPVQIDQILANLCLNSRDAIEGVGRITIETENACFDEAYCTSHAGYVPGEYVCLAVSDNGSGMDRETQEHIFEPFFTTKGGGKGSGLGLATIYGIVKQNNAFINVYSEPGQGTTFKIYLPRHVGRTERVAVAGDAEPIQRGQETVLLVEDEPSLLVLNEQFLVELGYRVLGVDSPEDAIQAAREHPGEIHLLMTDVVLPRMNGRDLALRIDEIRPGIRSLFMSGYTANVIAHRGVLDEGVNYLQKPFSVQALAAKLREVLERKRADEPQ